MKKTILSPQNKDLNFDRSILNNEGLKWLINTSVLNDIQIETIKFEMSIKYYDTEFTRIEHLDVDSSRQLILT